MLEVVSDDDGDDDEQCGRRGQRASTQTVVSQNAIAMQS